MMQVIKACRELIIYIFDLIIPKIIGISNSNTHYEYVKKSGTGSGLSYIIIIKTAFLIQKTLIFIKVIFLFGLDILPSKFNIICIKLLYAIKCLIRKRI
jgi:hypothetical protein